MGIKEEVEKQVEKLGDSSINLLTGKAAYEDMIRFKGGVEVANTILGVFGKSTEGVRKEVDGLSKAFFGLYEQEKTAETVMISFAALLKGNVSQALLGVTGLLKTAATDAQRFQVELIKYGQDQTFQKSIGEQAFALASLGIKYEDLKRANIGLIDNYNASIIISEKQRQSFEGNRKAMSELVVFNQKFGIEQAKTNEILNFTKNIMGGGTEQAIKLSEQMLKFADVTGQKADKVFGDFSKGLDRFAVMSSEKAIAQFEKLQATAARAGISMEGLVKGVQQFDDIDTAFEKGGQLNRVLSFMGGSFDTFKAFQADDDERARMMIEAISGVSEKYSQLQTDQARRNFARQISESTGGMFDMKQVVGILNKTSDLSKDLAEIGKMPLVTEGFTDKERTDKLVGLTTSTEFANVQDQLLGAGQAAQELAKNLRESSRQRTAAFAATTLVIDQKVLTPIFTAQTGEIKTALSDFKNQAALAIGAALNNPAAAFNSASTKMSQAVDSFAALMRTPGARATYSPVPPRPAIDMSVPPAEMTTP